MVTMSKDARVMDVCPFTNEPCGISDLCDSAENFVHEQQHFKDESSIIVKECSRTAAQCWVRDHLLRTKLCPFTDKVCADVGCCKDALIYLLDFDPTGAHGFFGDFGISEKRVCPYPIVKVRKDGA